MKRNIRQLLSIPDWDKFHSHPHEQQLLFIARPTSAPARIYQQRRMLDLIGKPIDWTRGMQGESVTRYVTAVIFDINCITINLSPEA